MLARSPHDFHHPPAGALTASAVIADLDAAAAVEFAERCTQRVAAQSGHPGFQAAYDRAMQSLRTPGWLDEPFPPGVVEAQMLPDFAAKLVMATRPPGGSKLVMPTDPVRLEADAAAAREVAWVWSTLAELEGFDDLDGAVLAAMAEQWALDFGSLLEAVRAATT
jgi:hypothetical protein